MLTAHDGLAKGCLALLKKKRVAAIRDRCRLQAEHQPSCEGPRSELMLSRSHKPVRRKEFVSTPRAALLLAHDEDVCVEHQHPFALHGHNHGDGSGIRLGACPGCAAKRDLLNERFWLLIH